MRPKFLTRLILCLVPTIIASGFAGFAFWKESQGQIGFRRGIDLAGGTILVYEVDRDRMDDKSTARGEGKRELTNDDIKQLAEKLKKRIDPTDLKNVVVRPIGNSRVEIILPFAGSTSGDKGAANEEFVQDVRNQVKQTGVLEFRILANMEDDREGILEAQRILDTPTLGDTTIADRAKAGKVPPAPAGTFKVKASGDEIDVRYEWVELGKEERESRGLSSAYAKEPPPKKFGKGVSWEYPQLEANRNRTHLQRGGSKGNQVVSYLYYNRPFSKQSRIKDEDGKDVEYFLLTRVSTADNVRVIGDVRISASSREDQDNNPAVGFNFETPAGSKMFRDMTERNKPTDAMVRSLAVIMDDKIVSAPTLNAVLPGSGIISGGSFTQKAVNQLVNILRSGNLNAELKPDPVSENTVGATLGESTIRKGLISVFASFAAVLLFMVYYYRFAGLVACVALFANLLLTIGFMVAVNAAFTLPGLAGLVLMLGMAVDANVLIYERIREEREKGATLLGAIRNGYDRALPTIIDTHLTSIFTAIVMYTFGNDSLKGFSVSLTVGLIISLFTSLFMTRLIFDYSMHRKWVTKLSMKRLFARPTFDFMRLRNKMFALTAGFTVAGLALFLIRGEKVLNVDFTQGTAYGGRLKEGEERSLSGTDGKMGMVELLGESRQKMRLNVKDVVPMLTGGTDSGTGEVTKSENIFKLVYDEGDGKIVEEKVTLATRPEGEDEAARLANLKARAAILPDASVEQVFLKEDSFGGNKARSFTVRTTEKEPELVQIMLDRLLRDEKSGEALMAGTKIKDLAISNASIKDERGVDKVGFTATLTFDQPTSPGYFKRFVERELKLGNRLPAAGSATALTISGVAAADKAAASEEERTGRFAILKLDFSDNIEFRAALDPKAKPEKKAEDEAALRKILGEAQRSFESRPLPERLEVFDPALASSTRNDALMAVALSWLAVLAFLWFRFGSWQFGLAAVICLIHDLSFTLGCIALCHYLHDTTVGQFLGLQDFKIDLAAVAALLTLVGYSVNDTIVVFDRIREVRGKSPVLTPQMINDSVNQTLSRTILASLTVFLVVGVLYIWGGEGVHLFAFVMVVGVIVGTYSSIYIASPLLLIFGEGNSPALLAAAAVPVSTSATAPSAVTD